MKGKIGEYNLKNVIGIILFSLFKDFQNTVTNPLLICTF